MNFRILHTLILSAALGCSAGCASSSQEQKPTPKVSQNESDPIVYEDEMPNDSNVLVGTWLGKLDFSGVSLTIVFNVERSSEVAGEYSATMDSPDQGARGIPVSKVVFEDGRVQFEVALANGIYEGILSENRESIEGSWSQGGQALPLNLALGNAEDVQKLVRPQEPQPPYPYAIEDVSFAGGKPTAGSDVAVVLAGTLTLPKTPGPHPVLVLLTGSGAQDRDETILGHKPFWVLADYLSRNGVAVLRMDDRGVAGSTGIFEDATTSDFVTDAVAAVDFLSTRKDINQDAIGLLGHSEGANVAPMASLITKKIDFVVLLAPTTVPGTELLARQNGLIFEGLGMSHSGVEVYEKGTLEVLQKIVKEPLDQPLSEDVRRQVRADYTQLINELNPTDRLFVTGGRDVDLENIVHPMVDQLSSVWMRHFLAMKPADTFTKLKVPTLALYGSKDVQVAAKQNAPPLRKQLAKNTDATITVFDGLNHLFQPAETGMIAEYATIETTLDPKVLETILHWLEQHGWASAAR